MGGKHHIGLAAKAIESIVDLLTPLQRVTDQGTPQCINIMNGASDIFRRPKCLELREPGIHFRRRLRARRVLKYHGYSVHS